MELFFQSRGLMTVLTAHANSIIAVQAKVFIGKLHLEMVEQEQTYEVTALGTIEAAHGDIESTGLFSPCRVTPGDDLLTSISEDGYLVIGYISKISGKSQGVLKELFSDAGVEATNVFL